MCLTTGNTSSYRDFAKKPSTLRRLLDSSQQTVKDIGYRIQHILSTLESGTPVAAVSRPGGRRDDDFNDFKEISILPTADEILCQQPPFIRPSSVLEDPDGEATRIVDYLGAAIFAQDIRAANPDVLLVEEAGEILESHVLTILGQNTSQMILIGDHKQLRPNYKLTVEKGDGFELDRSLFERLVLEGFPRETLTVQHRMRPEISAFIKKLTSTYPDLTDAPKTRGRDDIRGVRNNIIFIEHTHLEDNNSRISDKDDEASSGLKQNTYEVEMIWKIARYLAQQGYGTERLVVLTPYLGQLSKLQDAMKRDNDPVLNDLDSHDLIRAGLMSPAEKTSKKRIGLATIDNYQGEESDIVIASLTRSNESHDIGFMNSPEHLNVLISRARDGLILIGNSQTFINARRDKELWGKFFELVKQGNYMYEGFPIKCERHPHRKVLIKSASEFDTLCPNGGCTEIW
ncbi:AAA domain-containing protein [Suillus subluteus]|nr:AAA domain-containing protein [Suillus subluteus]